MADAENAPAPNGGGAPPPKAPETRAVPWERFQKVNEERKAVAAEVESLRGEIQSLTEKAATADTLASQLNELKAAHKTALAAIHEELALTRAGVSDPEDADLVRFHYGRLPAETKPKSVMDFIESLKVEGATVPKGLSHLFAPKAAGEPAPKNGQPAPKGPPAGGDGNPPPAGGKASADAIKRAMDAFAKQPSEENRKTLASLVGW